MTPEEFARARRLIAEHRRRPAAPALAAAAPRHAAARSSTCAASSARRSRPAATRSTARSAAGPTTPRKLVADPRRLRLDGGVRAGAAALPARRARLGTRRRDVRVRHAAHAADARARRRATPKRALAAAAQRVVDWSGGTRIGASLKAYNDEWGRRALTRGAVVVVLSDGCERGDPAARRRARWRGSRGRRSRSSGSTR